MVAENVLGRRVRRRLPDGRRSDALGGTSIEHTPQLVVVWLDAKLHVNILRGSRKDDREKAMLAASGRG